MPKILPPHVTRRIVRDTCEAHAAMGASWEAALRCARRGSLFDGCLTACADIRVLGASGSSSSSFASSLDSSGASAGTASVCRAGSSWKGSKKGSLK